MGKPHKPQTSEDWAALDFEIDALFDGAPVDEEQLFAGRIHEVTRMLQTVLERGKHVVLFGERGVGKTSLSNVFWKRFYKTLKSLVVVKVQASPTDDFTSLWRRALEELQATGQSQDEGLSNINFEYETLSQSQVRRELQRAGGNSLPVIIIDEFNEIIDQNVKLLTANLIKELYDHTVSTTIILVGVAENISELIDSHRSIERALIHIPLRRMSNDELREIISTRARRTVLEFHEDAIWTIVVLSRGLPYFTQTLSRHAAKSAILRYRTEINNEDVSSAMTKFIDDTEVSFREAYRRATRSNQDNNFQQSLLACALAKTDDEGFFSAADVTEPYSAIMNDPKRIAHFEKHLRRFSGEDGGNILVKRGGERQQTFRFADPMMQPYVIIRGIQSKMIDDNAKRLLLQRAQGELPV